MCNLAYHICECGAEYKCYSHDSECPVMNGYPELCGACEQMMDELRQEELEQEERRKWEEYEWTRR